MSADDWKVVQVKLKSGHVIRVIAECVVGGYAVHQRVVAGAAIGKGYSVTHMKSGISVYTVPLEADAVKCAKFLDQQGLDPSAGLEKDRYTYLITELQKIAPRYTPDPL